MKRKDKKNKGAKVTDRVVDDMYATIHVCHAHTMHATPCMHACRYDVLMWPPGTRGTGHDYRITKKHRNKEPLKLIKSTTVPPSVYTYTGSEQPAPSPYMFVTDIDFRLEPEMLR